LFDFVYEIEPIFSIPARANENMVISTNGDQIYYSTKDPWGA
jgi:hypothetical protein